MRILIVGGGIAGLTLAALLRQRGLCPTVVEKSPGYDGVGCVLGLWPVASRIRNGLALYVDLDRRSDAASLDPAIRLFVRRRRKRVDTVRTTSRRLARLSLIRWHWLARLRNRLVSLFNEKQLLGGIGRILEQPF